MSITVSSEAASPVALRSRTAEELMTPNPLSLRDCVTIREAAHFLISRGIGGAPVIDETGRPIGVLSQTDILIHDRETAERFTMFGAKASPSESSHSRREMAPEKEEETRARDLMTPAVFAVGLTTSARRVIQEMCELNIHRLFVVDGNGILVGVISALDVLRDLNASSERRTRYKDQNGEENRVASLP